ncbi:MAG: glycosyltransferase family 61 protein [Marinilabiliaceae bacterium]|nr:glycosyltransferase family 61 protein [Marinilabiliaceae bacterium]
MINRKPPINIQSSDCKYYQNDFIYDAPKNINWVRKGITLTNLFYIQKSVKLLAESHRNAIHIQNTPLIKRFAYTLRNAIGYKEKFTEKGVWALNPWAAYYYHWIAETLPRLFSVKDQIKNRYIILPKRFQNQTYIEPSLKIFNFKGVKYIDKNIVVDNLLYVSELADTGNFNNQITQEFHSYLRTYFEDYNLNSSSSERIYITRKKATVRRVVNEDELLQCIKKYNFKEIIFEDLSWFEQVKLVYNAKIIIGPHGAGLTNAIFMAQGTSLLELRPKGHFFFNCFYTMADAINLNYYYQTCDVKHPHVDPHGTDLIVNISELENNLTQIIDAQQ